MKRPHSEDLTGLGVAVLDALPISLYVVDRALRVVAWNRLREQGRLGLPRTKALGQPLSKLLTPKGYAKTAPIMRAVFESGEPHEESVESQDGSRLFRVHRFPVFQRREVTHVVSWFEDVTEQRALEMGLIASDRLAFLGQLVAGVAHEVSNPLASIAGCAEALASVAARSPDRASRKEAQEFRDLIRGEITRCEKIVRTLLSSARSDPSSTADVAATVGTVLRLLERHPAFTRVRVFQKIPKDLPPVRIESDSLKQVVMALAANAARAMAGGGKLTFVAAEAKGGRVHLDVLDTGPGVPKAILGRIFEPFFTSDSSQGNGLGLPIARSLVRGRGGDLSYRSRPGSRGAAFRVEMQAAQREGR